MTVSSSEGHLIELADCFTRTLGSWCCWPPQERVRGHRRWFVCGSIVLELTKADPIGNQYECIRTMQFELGTNWIRIRNEFTDQTLVPERELGTHGIQTRTQQESSGQELRIKSDPIVIRNPNWIDHQSR